MANDDITLQLGAVSPRRRHSDRGVIFTVIASLALHAGAWAFASWSASRTPPKIDYSRAIPVQLVKLGKPRDPKLLPRNVAPAPPPPADDGVALETKPDPNKKDPAASKQKTKDPEMSAAAKRLLESQALDKALSKINTPPEEAEGDPDGDIHGTTTDATNAATGYQREISRTLQANYRLPEAIPPSQRQFLKARVVLFIESTGRISHHEFVEQHPNPLFMSALEALLKSITLPPPPAAQAKAFREAGVEVIFRP